MAAWMTVRQKSMIDIADRYVLYTVKEFEIAILTATGLQTGALC